METQTAAKSFIQEIESIPGGEKIKVCMQCGTCTASCPNADVMDRTPAQIIAMARADMREDVLKSNAMWYCMSCYMCTVRCPRGVKITELMHVLESMANNAGLANKRTTTPIMYRTFNQFVSGRGRISEFWLILLYYFRTNPFRALSMMKVALDMLRTGRLSFKLVGTTPAGTKQLQAIIAKAESIGGEK